VDSAGIRVADSDREQLAEELREHMLAGRLTSDEFEERLARAYAAVTRAELDELRADLPMGVVQLQGALAQRRSKLKRRVLEEGGGAIGISGLCVGVWAASGANGSFWPIWVILVTFAPVVRNAWLLFGPAPDMEELEARLNKRRDRERRHHRRHGRSSDLRRPPRPPGLPR
jgi:Domain of unknown function (DUF1707)